MTKRKLLTPEQKIAIVREHPLERILVSTLVDKHKIHAVQFYQWQKLLFEEGALGGMPQFSVPGIMKGLVK